MPSWRIRTEDFRLRSPMFFHLSHPTFALCINDCIYRTQTQVYFFLVFQRRWHQFLLLRDSAGEPRHQVRRQVRVRARVGQRAQWRHRRQIWPSRRSRFLNTRRRRQMAARSSGRWCTEGICWWPEKETEGLNWLCFWVSKALSVCLQVSGNYTTTTDCLLASTVPWWTTMVSIPQITFSMLMRQREADLSRS